MQSINAGFHKLKSLLPVNDGEKISKANILQHAADFITTIERDRLMLHEQNTILRQTIKDIKFRSDNRPDIEVNIDILPTIPLNPRVAEVVKSDKPPQNKKGRVRPVNVAKAAIALPLEVPYTSETSIGHTQSHQDETNLTQEPRKTLKSETLSKMDPHDSAPKGQNLDAICKAIMEIESDRVFRNENVHGFK